MPEYSDEAIRTSFEGIRQAISRHCSKDESLVDCLAGTEEWIEVYTDPSYLATIIWAAEQYLNQRGEVEHPRRGARL